MMVLFVSDDMTGTRKACEEWLAARHCADPHMEISTAGALLAARREHYDCAAIDATAAALHEQYQRAQWTFGEIFQDCVGGLVFFQVGNATTRARETYERALGAAVLLHGKLSPLAFDAGTTALPKSITSRTDSRKHRALIVDYLDIAHGTGICRQAHCGVRHEGAPGGERRSHMRSPGRPWTKGSDAARDRLHSIAGRTSFVSACGRCSCPGNSAAVIDLARQEGLLGSCANAPTA